MIYLIDQFQKKKKKELSLQSAVPSSVLALWEVLSADPGLLSAMRLFLRGGKLAALSGPVWVSQPDSGIQN